jgi:2-dehydropantoate 2-reductase
VQLRENGLIVQQYGRSCLRVRVNVIETLAVDAAFDYVLVLVRNEQVESVLLPLASNQASPCLVFMFNNLSGPQRMIDALGQERVLLGFPGAAGERAPDGSVLATVLPAIIQKTTIGELDGSLSPRIRLLAAELDNAGFPTAISSRMDAWLKTHVALVSPIADAFYAAGEDLQVLAASKVRVRTMLGDIRSAFASLRKRGVPITPARMRCIQWLPDTLLVSACQWALSTSYANLIVARHATSAREEMACLSVQLHDLLAAIAPAARSD